MSTLAEACTHEITALHDFFAHWFRAAFADPDRAFERVTGVLAPGFVIISPRGTAVARASLLGGLRGAYGEWAKDEPPGQIMVESIRPHHVHGDLALLTYVERHHRPGVQTARLSTVLMQRHEGTPNGVCWLHVHETWMPGASPQKASP